jgi:hypothetical protein
VRRPVTSQDPFAFGMRPSSTTFASVTLSDAEPVSAAPRVPSRFSTSSSDDRRSPYFTLKPPVASSNRWMISGLKALVSPKRRNGSWTSTLSIMVRF